MKIFVASFSRSSDGAIEHLVSKMKEKNMWTNDEKQADYILAVGDRTETFDFVLKQFRRNKSIIHLWAGEVSQGTHDEVYRHSMTLMSMMQLCTNPTSQNRTEKLCRAVGKEPNARTVGNVMLDDLSVDESMVPKEPYDLVLYNPPTRLSVKEIEEELNCITSQLGSKFIWIEPNQDMNRHLVDSHFTHRTIPRKMFIGLLKNCKRFLTNSSCQYYEAPSFLKPSQIIPIGKRNFSRESKFSNMTIGGATNKIIKILEMLK